MIPVRFSYKNLVSWGILVDGIVHALEGDLFVSPQAGQPIAPLEQVGLLAPVTPTKIVAVGRNYTAHAAEFGNPPPPEPLLFLKPPSAVIGPGAWIGPGVVTQGSSEGRIVIGDDARIGAGAVLVAPLTVGSEARVAAGAVVARDVGAPATAADGDDNDA